MRFQRPRSLAGSDQKAPEFSRALFHGPTYILVEFVEMPEGLAEPEKAALLLPVERYVCATQ